MNNEIYEMAKNICECCGGRAGYSECGDCFEVRDSYLGCYGLAERLYDKGYHKIVWHKVADGDLPSNAAYVVVLVRFGSTYCASYDDEVKGFFCTGKYNRIFA